MGRKPKLTPEQEREVYERAQKGEGYDSIAESFGISKSSVTRVWQRLYGRAAAVPPTLSAADPQTGVPVELTPVVQLELAMRECSAMLQGTRGKRGKARLKLQIFDRLPKLAVAHWRIQQRPPAGASKSAEDATGQPLGEPQDLVRFN